mgnify:CR=1 FL=1
MNSDYQWTTIFARLKKVFLFSIRLLFANAMVGSWPNIYVWEKPLTREMPGEGLIHGRNVHFVESVEDIYNAVVELKDNPSYRHQLEIGAKAYFDQWLTPEKVIARLMGS